MKFSVLKLLCPIFNKIPHPNPTFIQKEASKVLLFCMNANGVIDSCVHRNSNLVWFYNSTNFLK